MNATISKAHDLDTIGWLEFSFDFDGRKYVSKISQISPLFDQIIALSPERFCEINQEALRDLIGYGATIEAVMAALIKLNKGATHAVIELKVGA